jgi:alpha/beta superfamily hydrolase
MAAHRESLAIEGPAGTLEALLELPGETVPRAVGLACHPHPLHGGTMDNKVVYTLARTFAGLGMAALRFNFRGVGESEGSYDEGRGEVDDALAAAAVLRERWPKTDLVVAGFSFGAAVAVRAAQRLDPLALVTVAPPIERLAPDEALPQCPWLIIHGENDELIGIDAVVAWLNTRPPGPALDVVAGADHFFHGKLGDVRAAVETFVTPFVDAAPDTVD